jgi:hypothetical protein
MQELEEGDGGGGGGSGYESDDDAGSSEAGAAAGGASTAGSACRGGGGSGGSGGAASAQGGGGANGDAAAVVGAGDTSGRLHNLRELADLDFEAGELSGRERELLSSCRALMESAAAVVKAFGRALLQGGLSAGCQHRSCSTYCGHVGGCGQRSCRTGLVCWRAARLLEA